MHPAVGDSEASRFNQMVLKKLQKALEADPEVDLASKIPSSYSSRLAHRKAKDRHGEDLPSERPELKETPSRFPKDDVRQLLDEVASVTVLFPLSESVRSLLESGYDEPPLAHSLHRLVAQSEVVWKPKFGRHKIVVKCSPRIVLKIMRDMDDFTEYTTLQYIEKFKPSIPAPRPLGLVRLGECFLLFMSFMPGTTLETVWNKLDGSLKRSVKAELNDICVELRSLTRPDNMPLGGVAGEGCKDLRRNVRRTAQLMWTTKEFDDWQFSNPHFGSLIYIETLRRLSPPLPQKHVLSHNDLRPNNILVEVENGQCHVTGIIDWQYSGFYPEYYESTKVMNGISPNEDSDWYLFIPESISPLRNAQKWLLDALWWKHVE